MSAYNILNVSLSDVPSQMGLHNLKHGLPTKDMEEPAHPTEPFVVGAKSGLIGATSDNSKRQETSGLKS